MKRVEVEITKEQAKQLVLPYPNEYWLTMTKLRPQVVNENDSYVFHIHGRTLDPITKEGVEGLGFKECDTISNVGLKFSKGTFEIFVFFGDTCTVSIYDNYEMGRGENKTKHNERLFLGKLNTIQELRTILKQVGVL